MIRKDKSPMILKMVRWFYPKVEKIAPSIAHRFFVRLFFSPLQYEIPAKEKKAETFAEKFAVKVADKKIQCYSWGEGNEIVLLVHGWAGRATQFRRFIKPLNAAGFRVVGFDGPAHANSEGKRTDIFEFEKTLLKIYDKIGMPKAIIAHSFGGGAVLLAAMNGMQVNKLITIASPTIGDEIINTYLKAINASSGTENFFRAFIIRKFNKPFDDFTSLHFIKNLPNKINLLLVHDENDKEVSIEHPLALLKVYPEAIFYKTQGLGHTRILKDDEVIKHCVTYIAH